MQITITSRHMELTDALKNHVENKVIKIKKYVENAIVVHVVLAVEKYRHIAEVTLQVDGQTIKGVEETGDMYSSIDKVMSKIERQAKKHKEIISKHSHQSNKEMVQEDIVSPSTRDVKKADLVTTKKLTTKPMSVEEAVMQMNLISNDFMVFENSNTNKINVIYHLKDGDLGLIEPN